MNRICFFARSSIDRLYSTLLLLRALRKNALTTKIIVGLNIDREHLISYRISTVEKREKRKRKKEEKRKKKKWLMRET